MPSDHSTAPLLIELLTEELPPKALKRLGAAFASVLFERLVREGVCAADAVVTDYASPRRLAVLISAALAQAPNRLRREKLLPVAIALDSQGKATAPLIKKLATLGVNLGSDLQLQDLERVSDGKQDVFFYQFQAPGASLTQAVQAALDDSITKLPIPKVMGYQRPDGSTVKFVRPAHHLVALHGDRVIPITALGLTADRITQGHRFHTHAPLSIRHANDYAAQLRTEGRVIASFAERQALISTELQRRAGHDQVVMPQALLDEVTSLVEWPVVLEGHFEKEFLSVPQECLILTMQQNQKYFALTDQHNKLVNRFLLVSNIESKDPQVIVSGNERVLRARLADAKFFFDQDRKKPLISRLEGLSAVVYHNKIGNQRQRIDRLAALASQWAPALGADPAQARRAAQLAKADLLTDMVGEFPELQGVIGTYYALHDQEPPDVAAAIEGHYRPRFAGDELAANATGNVLALADKLETLVGIWGIGLAPTGDKDPFALRRHALGVVRILVEKAPSVSLRTLLEETAASFSGVTQVNPDLNEIHNFVLDRMRGWLKDKGYIAEEIEAVLAVSPNHLDQVEARLNAVRAFMMRPEAASLCAANKRITNILKKTGQATAVVNPAHLVEPAERTLAEMLSIVAPQTQQQVLAARYTEALEQLATLKAPVDGFFDAVMVMAEDPKLRENRLALMQQLHTAMNQVADLSRLAV